MEAEKEKARIQKVENRVKLLVKSLGGKLAPQLSIPRETADWGELLDQFFVCSKQLDELVGELSDKHLQVNNPVPRKPFPENASFPAPQLLSTKIPSEDVESIVVQPEGSNSIEEKEAIVRHNVAISNLIGIYNGKVDTWKKESKEVNLKREREKRALELEEEARKRRALR